MGIRILIGDRLDYLMAKMSMFNDLDSADPTPSHLFVFQIKNNGAAPRLADISEATLKALARGEMGAQGSKQHLSIPSVNLHITLKENLPSKSCKSTTWFPMHKDSSNGKSFSHTSSSIVFLTKYFNDLAVNSWLASLRWVCHSSPSTLKMPWPRKSPRMSVNGLPFGKLLKLVLRMYSTFCGFAVTMVVGAPRRWRTMVLVGE
ncbi:Zinc finger MYM-type protein 1 [Senna tora]|uniref:Zinc finger MYM-type protein 1 n=1 Tax=Senna tora TaxID=362788 RepID=A0A834TDN2_9FABA|nr:Zinc finger MYM-type protein 1 [Senna tora]